MPSLRSLSSRLVRAETKAARAYTQWWRQASQAERDRWQQHTLLALVRAGVLPPPDPDQPQAHFRDVMAQQPLAYQTWYTTHLLPLCAKVQQAEATGRITAAAGVVIRAWMAFKRTLPR